MPAPVSPASFLELIPAPGGNFCEKFALKLLRQLPERIYQLVAYERNPDGSISDAFKADICALNCVTGTSTGGTVGGLQTPVIMASDGQFADKVQINWTAVTAATFYDLYRAGVNSSATASLLAANIQDTTYDDTTVTPGVIYYYFIKAKNASQTSGFSAGDMGHAGTIQTTLAAVTDLVASHGFGGPAIGLQWSVISGADSYDVFVNKGTDDFTQATQIQNNAQPVAFSSTIGFTGGPLVDNGGTIVSLYTPADADKFAVHYFWVRPKRAFAAPPADGPVITDGADGWAHGDGVSALVVDQAPLRGTYPTDAGYLFQVGYTKLWFSLRGGYGGGGGAASGHGGGGAGYGQIAVGYYDLGSPVAGVSRLRIRYNPSTVAVNGGIGADGDDAPEVLLEYSALGTWADTVEIAKVTGSTGGMFSASSDGAAGVGGTATVHASVTRSVIYDGDDGDPASGANGGSSGHYFSGIRAPQAEDQAVVFNTPREGAGARFAGQLFNVKGGRGRLGDAAFGFKT